ncbi:sensor histidine kinase [Lacihabitans sp. CCS-44]|uniref:sensor histidine kinase n=1 Tax=Lacihabitans sp. CCS-44 TaxID=2487331 RepID=UPI0020CE01F0|nr:ATP-binding protein [Lacihabitans sp. CCS-44]
MLSKLIDYFLPVHNPEFTNGQRDRRLIIMVMLIAVLADFLGVLTSLEIDAKVIIYTLGTNFVLNIILLFLYKNGLSKAIVVHLFLAHHAISIYIQAFLQGGLMTPGCFSLFLLPALAILLLGKRAAIIWVCITILLITSFFVYESFYEIVPVGYDLEKKKFFFFSSLVYINITIFFILMVYENSKTRGLSEIEKKNHDLLEAQAQLIQAEKMASLGELTAGIAHEIQNPLNFVNNFSELNQELIVEMEKELEIGNFEAAKEISRDIVANEGKIIFHGKRADAIVKGMLLHSRTSTGKKEPSDLNELVDEYVRLTYQGLRAKNKSFNTAIVTDFDEQVGQVNIVPQDIGRVILNLLNNAFYAVNERALSEVGGGFIPKVTVSTELISLKKATKNEKSVLIKIADNGGGIAPQIAEKIFQPFFTTKPTGKGTGLGLSLSYDIVTKGHGGQMTVESVLGEGATFVLKLPIE